MHVSTAKRLIESTSRILTTLNELRTELLKCQNGSKANITAIEIVVNDLRKQNLGAWLDGIIGGENLHQILTKLSASCAAHKVLMSKPLFLDTETTGTGYEDEVVDLAIIDSDGTVLLNTLVKPVKPIPPEATAIHKISHKDVVNAPTIVELLPRIEAILTGRVLAIYNADYDTRIIWQSLEARKLPTSKLARMMKCGSSTGERFFCIMKNYADFYGEWDSYHQNFAWQKLSQAAKQCGLTIPTNLHRALADAELARQVLMHVASYAVPPNATTISSDYEKRVHAEFEDASEIARRDNTLGWYGLDRENISDHADIFAAGMATTGAVPEKDRGENLNHTPAYMIKELPVLETVLITARKARDVLLKLQSALQAYKKEQKLNLAKLDEIINKIHSESLGDWLNTVTGGADLRTILKDRKEQHVLFATMLALLAIVELRKTLRPYREGKKVNLVTLEEAIEKLRLLHLGSWLDIATGGEDLLQVLRRN